MGSGKGVRRWCGLLAMIIILGSGTFSQAGATSAVAVLPGPGEPETLAPEGSIRLGLVEGFTMDRVYIDGMAYPLSKNIEYFSSLGEPIRQPWVKQGCRVKYVLGPEREVEIIQVDKGQGE